MSEGEPEPAEIGDDAVDDAGDEGGEPVEGDDGDGKPSGDEAGGGKKKKKKKGKKGKKADGPKAPVYRPVNLDDVMPHQRDRLLEMVKIAEDMGIRVPPPPPPKETPATGAMCPLRTVAAVWGTHTDAIVPSLNVSSGFRRLL